MPIIQFLLDEDVPEAVAQFLRDREHNVQWSRALVPIGSPNQLVVQQANLLHAVVVTWNRRHFHPLIQRQPAGVRLRFPHAGLLSFKCDRAIAVARLSALIRFIERAYEEVQGLEDQRLIFEIWKDKFSIHR